MTIEDKLDMIKGVIGRTAVGPFVAVADFARAWPLAFTNLVLARSLKAQEYKQLARQLRSATAGLLIRTTLEIPFSILMLLLLIPAVLVWLSLHVGTGSTSMMVGVVVAGSAVLALGLTGESAYIAAFIISLVTSASIYFLAMAVAMRHNRKDNSDEDSD